MTASKRTKNSRQRGTHTHGWGAKKKHRGKGNKGGSGNSSSGKRSDARKPSIWKDKDYFGKRGFHKKGLKEDIKAVNIGYIEQNLEALVSGKKITEDKGVYSINLKELGYNKLLGTGRVKRKYRIEAKYASKIAEERIKQAGGEIIKQE